MKKKLVGIVVVTLLTAATVLPVIGTINIDKTKETTVDFQIKERNNSYTNLITKTMAPPLFWQWFNADWDYWTNAPNIYCIPAFTGDEYDGEVGIGTDDPTCKLDVRGPVSIKSWKSGLDGRDAILYVEADRGTEEYYYQIRTVSKNGTNFVITNAGQVGIKTRYPETALHVKYRNSSTNNVIQTLESDDGKWRIIVTGSGSGIGSDKFCIKNQDTPNKNEFVIDENGNVGIGTSNPGYKLDVEGAVQAQSYYTGDIIFQKDGEKIWRMFEDEDGLYLENLNTGQVYTFVLQEQQDTESLNQKISDLEARIAELEALIR